MRSLSIFGSTGSIGKTTLSVIRQQKETIKIETLTGGSNVSLLAHQAIEFRANAVVIANERHFHALKELLKDTEIKISAGRDAILAAALESVDLVMSAVVGFEGLEISLIAAKNCKTLALANKESLVCAGSLLREVCRRHKTNLIPVDSEHSAIFQCLNGEDPKTIERIIITASGGPFLYKTLDEMQRVTPEEAMDHPNWSMGKRISIDSASMFNKAMELIEAKELFDLKCNQIEILVHPQSIVHSMVGFIDGNMMAQMGPPDMAGAIGYALNWPYRKKIDMRRLTVADLTSIRFETMDDQRFPAVSLARRVTKIGELSGVVFNAAKEQALDLFLENKIGFLEMTSLVKESLDHYEGSNWNKKMTLKNIKNIDRKTRNFLKEITNNKQENI